MKNTIAIFILTVLTFSCKDKVNTVTTENTQIIDPDSSNITISKKSQPTVDLIDQTENNKLNVDTTADKDKIHCDSIKFEPCTSFDEFKVSSVDHKKYADLDLKSNKDASNFRTILTNGYSSDTANFAGHYSFVYWGCGSPCQMSLVIDRKTGKIYASPMASLGYDFRVYSKMLIVNPPDTNGFYDNPFNIKPVIYLFDEQTKTFIECQRK